MNVIFDRLNANNKVISVAGTLSIRRDELHFHTKDDFECILNNCGFYGRDLKMMVTKLNIDLNTIHVDGYHLIPKISEDEQQFFGLDSWSFTLDNRHLALRIIRS